MFFISFMPLVEFWKILALFVGVLLRVLLFPSDIEYRSTDMGY